MSYLKIAGLLLLAVSFIMGGALQGSKYRRRGLALEEARALIHFLRSQLAFTLAPPAALLQSARNDPAFYRCDYLDKANRLLDEQAPAEVAWQKGIQQSAEPFSSEDRTQLSRVGEILGKSDLSTQISQLSLVAERIEQQAAQAREEATTKSRLCTTLGALCGLTLIILFY